MNKIILVTGGNRGIGYEICRQLADLGHQVILGARSKTKGEEAAATIDGSITVHQLDVTSKSDLQNVAKQVKEAFGKLDVLVNNAGISPGSTGVLEATMEEVKQVMETNFYGPWSLSQAMMPLLKKSKEGRIINFSSGMGTLDGLASGGYAGYRLSKVSLNALTIQMASELSNTNIKVNAVCPGWVRTDMGGSAAPGSVEEGADTAVWLATAAAIPSAKFFRDRKEIDW